MSGLDGLGWPTPENEPKPKKTINSQLEIKLAPTPETDAMEYCDSMCDPDRVVEADFARKLERERDEAQERADTMFADHADILDQTRNERDDLAAALNRACANPTTGNWYREAQDALAAWKERRKS